MNMKTPFFKISLVALGFAILGISSGCKQTNPIEDPKDTVKTTTDSLAKGADVSWVTQMEANGKKFYNAAGTEMECMALLKSLGMNTIRLRVWVNPADNWNNTADVLV